MAYKEGNPLMKLIIFAAIVFAAYKFGWPWVQKQGFLGTKSSVSSKGGNGGCVDVAMAASDAWGSGVTRFMNPPVDQSAWSDFRSDIDGRISRARSACDCADVSCAKVRAAMTDLSSLVSDMDNAVRSGAPPTLDIVGAQDRIDTTLNEARAALGSSK